MLGPSLRMQKNGDTPPLWDFTADYFSHMASLAIVCAYYS